MHKFILIKFLWEDLFDAYPFFFFLFLLCFSFRDVVYDAIFMGIFFYAYLSFLFLWLV
jgi:hypothetical protein